MKNGDFALRLLDYSRKYNELKNFSHIYIYGAGNIGRHFAEFLHTKGLGNKISGFIVTKVKKGRGDTIDNIPVKEIDEVTVYSSDIIILAVTNKYREDIKNNCLKRGIKNFIEVDEFDDIPPMYFLNVPKDDYEEELKKWYYAYTGEHLNLINPKTFNEKIQWLKLYEEDPRKTKYSDKYLVRMYVEEIIGKDYLIPLLGVWENTDSIDFDMLPNSFILKCTHGSGMNIIVTDKSKMNNDNIIHLLDKWMKIDLSMCSLERHYHNIRPRIIAEEYIEDPFGDLRDYKFWCFNGEVKIIQVDIDRKIHHKRNMYSIDWDLLPYMVGFPTAHSTVVLKPQKLDEMIDISRKLSRGFNYVRVDLYYTNNTIFFGEMTFTHGSGQEHFEPKDFAYTAGSWLDLPIR